MSSELGSEQCSTRWLNLTFIRFATIIVRKQSINLSLLRFISSRISIIYFVLSLDSARKSPLPMDIVSSNSIRFHRVIITFACLPLFAWLLISVFSSSGVTQTVKSVTQATPPTLMGSERLPHQDLPQMVIDIPLVATELPREITDLCIELDWVPDRDFCTHPDQSTSILDHHQLLLSVADQGHATIPTIPK